MFHKGNDKETVELISRYFKSIKLFRENNEEPNSSESTKVVYSELHVLDLSTIVPCMSGPKRSLDKIPLFDLKTEFTKALTSPLGFNVCVLFYFLIFK